MLDGSAHVTAPHMEHALPRLTVPGRYRRALQTSYPRPRTVPVHHAATRRLAEKELRRSAGPMRMQSMCCALPPAPPLVPPRGHKPGRSLGPCNASRPTHDAFAGFAFAFPSGLP